MPDIKIPTLFVNAADDMFSPSRAFPLDKIRQNPNTAMVVTKYGGNSFLRYIKNI